MKTITKPLGRRTIEIERLGPELCKELFEFRSSGATYEESLKFVHDKGFEDVTKWHLQAFFRRYGLIKAHKDVDEDPGEKQLARRNEMSRRIDLVSSILENQIIALDKNKDITPVIKAAKIGELCKVMLETVTKDVTSQQTFDKVDKVTNTNVQVNIGDQLKEVAKKKESLRKQILSANYDLVETKKGEEVKENVKSDDKKSE